MNANRSFLKSFLISLFFIIPLVPISKAQAIYIFEWNDSGQEWYTLPNHTYPTTGSANKWKGFFTLPDSAVSYGANYGDYKDIYLDLTQYLDFSLTGKLISGNYMEASAFQGASLTTPQLNDSEDIELYFFTGEITFVMANPSWINTPLYLTVIGEDHWYSYNDFVFDADRDDMVTAYINHDGIFVGYYVDDSVPPPVPEPATMVLLGTGIVGLVIARIRKKTK